jgi:D-3-phosphoglycerate dehydrogenase
MRVIGYDPSVESAPGVGVVKFLDELFNRVDYISLHVPYTKETHNILDANAFEKMKQGVYIINCSRGGTMDENALYDAIKNGKVAGAALDVYTEEPSMGHKLYTLEQVIGSPHVGAGTVEAIAQVGVEAARNVINVLNESQKNGKD